MNAYQEKIEAKKERYQELAQSKAAQANALHARAHEMASAIPFGQPILVGHHSEGRDRRYRARIEGTYSKAFEASDTAEYYKQKAATVGTGGISSDDPDAIEKLQAKLAKCEANQVKMVSANKLIRKNDRAGLVALGFTEKQVEELFKPDFCGRIGYPSFETQNNNAEIHRLKDRIAHLSKIQTAAPVVQESELYTYKEEEGRCQFEFDGKPSDEIREILKSNAFKWSPSRGTWVRQLTGNGQYASRRVKEALAKISV